jgi:hypothetical protein
MQPQEAVIRRAASWSARPREQTVLGILVLVGASPGHGRRELGATAGTAAEASTRANPAAIRPSRTTRPHRRPAAASARRHPRDSCGHIADRATKRI